MSDRPTVSGFGINDADYNISSEVNGKLVLCPYYVVWKNMIHRAYNKKSHAKNPKYARVDVCDEWRSFMTFRDWMMKQDWRGKELDKDILIPYNKIYSPEACMFVTKKINSLLGDKEHRPSEWPRGVYLHKASGLFHARVHNGEGYKSLGYYRQAEDAAEVYKNAKADYINELAKECDDPKLSAALAAHSLLVLDGAFV